jgi:hypothetical protein
LFAAAQVTRALLDASSIAFCSLTLPKLLSHKERSVYLLDSLAQQAFDKRKSFTVDEANVFQIDGELQPLSERRLCGRA